MARVRRLLDGRSLRTSEEAIADEISAAATLLMGQGAEGRPLVLVRGFRYDPGDSGVRSLIRNAERDLFRT